MIERGVSEYVYEYNKHSNPTYLNKSFLKCSHEIEFCFFIRGKSSCAFLLLVLRRLPQSLVYRIVPISADEKAGGGGEGRLADNSTRVFSKELKGGGMVALAGCGYDAIGNGGCALIIK